MYGDQNFPPTSQYHGYVDPCVDQTSYSPSYGPHYSQNFYYTPDSSRNDTPGGQTTSFLTLERRKKDEEALEKFINESERSTEECLNKSGDSRTPKISEAKDALRTIYKLNKDLELTVAELKDDTDLPELEWRKKLKNCMTRKFEIRGLLEKFRDPRYLSSLKESLEKRKKTRLRQKRERATRRVEKTIDAERRAQLHAKADKWIKAKREIIEKEKQEENLRKDADMVLSDVRSKRSDARKFLGVLQELRNLRRVKVNIARARGEHLSSAADEAFDNIIVRLVEQWTALDREYSIEEQGLKLMLKTDNEQKIEKQKRNTFDDWECVLFGKKTPGTDLFRDLNSFVTIRCAWDKFIACDNQGSPIPIGWVMPDLPSSAAWQKYLRKE